MLSKKTRKKVFIIGVMEMNQIKRLREEGYPVLFLEIKNKDLKSVLDWIKGMIRNACKGKKIDFSLLINVIDGVIDNLQTEE